MKKTSFFSSLVAVALLLTAMAVTPALAQTSKKPAPPAATKAAAPLMDLNSRPRSS